MNKIDNYIPDNNVAMDIVGEILLESFCVGGYIDEDDAENHIRKTVYERWTLDWPYSPKKHVRLALECDLNAVAGYLRDLAEPLYEMYEKCYMGSEPIDALNHNHESCELKGLSKEEIIDTVYDLFKNKLEDLKEIDIDEYVYLNANRIGSALLAKVLTDAFYEVHYRDYQ